MEERVARCEQVMKTAHTAPQSKMERMEEPHPRLVSATLGFVARGPAATAAPQCMERMEEPHPRLVNVNRIGDDGAKAIAEALKVNAVVKILDLGNNSIGNLRVPRRSRRC